MAKKISGFVKLQIPAGKASPAPPVGSALGPHGINIMGFCKEFNERTNKLAGNIVPVVITVYQDHSFSFVTKSPPASDLIKKACKVEKGSGRPQADKIASITQAQLAEIAETKKADLNAADLEAAKRMIAGTCRSMGVTIAD